jgi:non-ribosomal peptide synthetase component F
MTDARMRRLHAHRAFEREPYPDSMGALLDQAAARFGDHPAFVFFQTGERLTFRDLKERADRLAAALARLGVVKGHARGADGAEWPRVPGHVARARPPGSRHDSC